MLPAIKTILYATGLGPGAPYVFRYAMALAQQHQAKIVAVHGMEPLSAFGQSLVEQYISHETSEEMHNKARESVRAKLQQRMELLCQKECQGAPSCTGLVSSIRVVEGYPAQVILEVALDCSADIIVMGAHSQTAVGEVMVGSTTRKPGCAALSRPTTSPKTGANRVISPLRDPGSASNSGPLPANAAFSAAVARGSATTGCPTKSQVMPAAVM